MSIIATLSTTPVQDDTSSDEIAAAIEALDNYDVEYEVNPIDTTIEATDISELFAAVQAAHQAVEADRVNTKLEINHERHRDRDAAQRVTAVQNALTEDGAETGVNSTAPADTEGNNNGRDTVDMSGHAPEETEDDPQQDEVNMKGDDYKTEETDETNEESVSERYYDGDDETGEP